jgi:uncharacterized membrane protein YesL
MIRATNWYIRIGNWGFRLLILNILWIVFSAMGLFILGLFPATTALFGVIRKEIITADTQNVPTIKSFWEIYKTEFLRSNLLGYIYTIFGVLLFFDLRVLHHLNSSVLNYFFIIVTYIIILFYSLTFFYLFPILVHFQLRILDYIKYSVILMFARPMQALILIVSLFTSYYLFLFLPGLIPLMGISLISFIIMKTAIRSFPRPDTVPIVE